MIAPFARITVDPALNVADQNEQSVAWPGKHTSLSSLLDEDSKALILDDDVHCIRTLVLDRFVEIHLTRHDSLVSLWFVNIDEQRHLQDQIKNMKRPDRKLVRNLHNLIATIRSQGELVSVMLEHGDEFSLDQLKVIRGCQSEINAKLMQCDNLIDAIRLQRTPSQSVSHPSKLLIYHSDPTRAELLAELFRLEGWQVDHFSTTKAALRFAEISGEAVSIAIVESEQESLATLTSLCPTAKLVILDADGVGQIDARHYGFGGKPLDINELQGFVASLLTSE